MYFLGADVITHLWFSQLKIDHGLTAPTNQFVEKGEPLTCRYKSFFRK